MCTIRRGGRLHRGFTLIELVLFIVVVGIAVGGVLVAYDHAVRDSADPFTRKQALAIGESLLAEIQQMPFTYCDPDDPAVSTAASPAACAIPEAIGPEAGETRYSTATPFDNVNDYDGYDTSAEAPPGMKDLTGTPIAGLGGYNARVSVAPAALGGIPAGEALLISIQVTGPANVSVRLEGYRTRHAPNL
jgi:MSHA pilin protein MshD